MKRIFRFLFFLAVLLIGAAVILPIVFKDSIVERVKKEANANLNAKINFTEVDLSLVSTFPYFGLSIEGFEITGLHEFADRKLIEAGEFELSIDLLSVLSGGNYSIEKIALKDVYVDVIILKNGVANYDITLPSDETAPPVTEEATAFNLALTEYSLTNFNLKYTDLEGDMSFSLKELDHIGRGDFSQDIVAIKTHTEAKSMTFIMEDLAYLNRVHLESDFDMDFDQNAFRFNFGENSVVMNGLKLNFDGWLSMPEEAIDMDLNFKSPNNDFKSLISLIPAVYYEGFESLKTSGEFQLKGNLKGRMLAETYPSYDFELLVREGEIQYPELPAAIKDVNIDLRIINPTDKLEGTEIQLNRMEAHTAGSAFSASLNLKDPLGDPDFKFLVQATVNLADFAKAVPMEGYEMQGSLEADMNASGRMSMIDNEQYEALKAGGFCKAQGLIFAGDSMPMAVNVPKANLSLNPESAVLGPTTLILEGQEMNFDGQLNNLIAYALRDELLTGTLNFYSPKLDLMALAGEEAAATESSSDSAVMDSAVMAVIRLPQNIDFKLKALVDTVVFNQLTMAQLKGDIELLEGKALMKNVNTKMLGGDVAFSGTYNSKPEVPEADFDFQLKGISFKESYISLEMVQQIAPIMQNVEGKYSLGLSMTTLIGPEMTPLFNSINANGLLNTNAVQTGGKVFDQLATFLNNPDYQQVSVNDVDLNFTIEDGRLEVEPFEFKVAGQVATLGGAMTLDQSLDFKLDTKISPKMLKSDKFIGQLGSLSGGIPLIINIGGTATDPEVRPSLGNLSNLLKDELSQKVTSAIDTATKKVKKQVNDKLESLILEAETKGDALIVEARKRGDQLKAAAKTQADNLRAQGEASAQKILKEAGSNRLKLAVAGPLAEKAKKEANENAQKLEDEAAKQANALVQTAEDQKKKLLEDAKTNAKV